MAFSIIIITPPSTVKNEALICNNLFFYGLQILHLRKPDASESDLCKYIEQIEPKFRNRIVLHSHYNLVRKYNLRGIHLKSTMASEYTKYDDIKHISISCHSYEEIAKLPFIPTYAFISPVFDSISKSGYCANQSLLNKEVIQKSKIPLIALGGIDNTNISICRTMGFAGAATIGYIWNRTNLAVERYRLLITPNILSVAGFDPSSGAGVSADIKTAQMCGAYGMGVVTAITFQSASHYNGTRWVDGQDIVLQIKSLLQEHKIEVVKIGLVENKDTILLIIKTIKEFNDNIKIVWDPILKATASNRDFHGNDLINSLKAILKEIDLITPNNNELASLFSIQNDSEIKEIAKETGCAILRKGGHIQGNLSIDTLFDIDGSIYQMENIRLPFDKHGTGCFLSTAICSYLAQGYVLSEACKISQKQISSFIASNDISLGFHNTFINKTKMIPECKIMYISDHRDGYTIAEQVEEVCKGGVKWIQLRMKDSSDEEMLATGKLVKDVCKRYNAVFIINDRVHIAKALDADGVHLGKSDMDPLQARLLLGEDKIIGATCNTFADMLLRHKQQVDYVGVGPYRFTTTKKNLSPILGVDGYVRLIEQCKNAGINIPIYAIGGITINDFDDVLSTGVAGIALSGEILRAENISSKAEMCVKLVEK